MLVVVGRREEVTQGKREKADFLALVEYCGEAEVGRCGEGGWCDDHDRRWLAGG